MTTAITSILTVTTSSNSTTIIITMTTIYHLTFAK